MTGPAKPVYLLDFMPGDWREAVAPYVDRAVVAALSEFVVEQYRSGPIFPRKQDIYAAYRLCPLAGTRVLILGQDPYIKAGQAHGLSFSVPRQIIGDTAGSPPHLLQHTSGALICVYGRREPPYGQRAMFSRDGGANWDADYILDDSAANPDLGYPATVELKDGRLLTVYYENTGGRSSIMQQIWELPE
jgi:hypothetical protein